LTSFSGQRLQANLITFTSGGSIILIGNGSVLQTGDDAVVLVHAAGGQAHGQTDTLLNDGALQEDVLAQLAFLAGDDGVGDLAHQVVGLLALDVHEREKQERSRVMNGIAEEVRREVLAAYVGTEDDVLLETPLSGTLFTGYTRLYIPVVVSAPGHESGQIVHVRLGEYDGERVRAALC